MSFDMEYDKHGNPVSAKNVEVVVEELQTPEATEHVEEIQAQQESEQPASEPEVFPEPEETIEQEPETIPAKKKTREANFEELREAKWQAERKARELEEEVNRLRHKAAAPQKIESYNLDEDSLVEGRHLSAVERKIQAMEEKIAQYEQQSLNSRIEMQLKHEYPDFDSVVSASNIKKLQESYPDLAATLFAGTDLRAKGSSAYIMIKKLGISPEERQNVADKAQAVRNSIKPRPVASISPQNSTSPLSKIQTFTQDTEMTPELQEHLIREMNSAIKRRGM